MGRIGRSLSTAEMAAFDHVPETVRNRTILFDIPWLPGSFAGITLGRYILLTRPPRDDGSSTLIAHELVHVDQWSQRGAVRFLAWYLGDFWRELRSRRQWMPAYRAVRAEVQARERTRHWWEQRRPDPVEPDGL
jgi:hypothetical protein